MSIADKHIIFGGAGGRDVGTPWGTLGEIAGRVLEPLGFSLEIEARAFTTNNPRYVSDGRADFGATRLSRISEAYKGIGPFDGEGARDNLRIFGSINMPGWLGIAVRWETNITDLGQIAERRLPVRVYDSTPRPVGDLIWSHYGLSHEMIESWGGRMIPHHTAPNAGLPNVRAEWARSGSFDVIIDSIYSSYTPEIVHWHEASIRHNLRFLPLPEELVGPVATGIAGKPGYLPHNLFRGVTGNVRTAMRGPQTYYGREDAPDDFVYEFCRAIDENRHVFREAHLPFSYDPYTVCESADVPLHDGASAYYRERGYLTA